MVPPVLLQGDIAGIAPSPINANIPIQEHDAISIEVVAKLKKEFHCHQTKKCYKFMCNLQRQKDMYHPKLSVTEIVV
jgi:hypothetical protein